MNYLSTCVSALLSCCPLLTTAKPPSYHFTQTIHGKDLSFHLVTPVRDSSFFAICNMYKIEEETLSQELQDMVLWCIYDKENKPIGAIDLHAYPSLESLSKQVTDEPLSRSLFSSQKTLELSYALSKEYQGKGLGSKAVKEFLDHARSCN